MAKRKQRSAPPRVVSSTGRNAAQTDGKAASGTRGKAGRGPRTASGKKADPHTMADAAQSALAGLRERTEEGHLKAGRTPPSQTPTLRSSGATREVDDAIRSPYATITEDEKLLQQPRPYDDFTRTDPW